MRVDRAGQQRAGGNGMEELAGKSRQNILNRPVERAMVNWDPGKKIANSSSRQDTSNCDKMPNTSISSPACCSLRQHCCQVGDKTFRYGLDVSAECPGERTVVRCKAPMPLRKSLTDTGTVRCASSLMPKAKLHHAGSGGSDNIGISQATCLQQFDV